MKGKTNELIKDKYMISKNIYNIIWGNNYRNVDDKMTLQQSAKKS